MIVQSGSGHKASTAVQVQLCTRCTLHSWLVVRAVGTKHYILFTCDETRLGSARLAAVIGLGDETVFGGMATCVERAAELTVRE